MARRFLRGTAFVIFCLAAATATGQEKKPLTNNDVVEMVRSGLPETTIIKAMQANPSDFDVTPSALIALHEAGVSQKVMDAMIGVAMKKNTPARTPAAGQTTPRMNPIFPAPRSTAVNSTPAASLNQPSVTVVRGDAREAIPVERTRLVQTKTKPESLAALSKDKALGEGLRTGITAVGSYGGRAGSVAAGQAGQILRGMVRNSSSKTVTYVWALQKPASPTTLSGDRPVFEVALNNAAGVRPDEYAPAIVRLTPAGNNSRLVGATEGKTGATSSIALDWPVYSSFVEDKVQAQSNQVSTGVWQVSATGTLEPGEYGVVLRPLSKNTRFSGAEVARNQGAGLLFNSVWSFSVR